MVVRRPCHQAHPRAEHLWLRFAAFQTESLALTGKRTDAAHASEKKRAILVRGLSHNPESEALTLALMEESAKTEDAGTVKGRWRRILGEQPDKPALWRAYLAQVRNIF